MESRGRWPVHAARHDRGGSGPDPPRALDVRGFVGQDAKVARVLDVLGLVADSDATVLILGESGTGKELIARAVHENSARREGPFVPVNCGAVVESLQEAEFFGHVAGAFTGANQSRVGRLEAANGGTLFLDEICDMKSSLQGQLLRVLQSGEYTPVGVSTPRSCNIRVVAASKVDLEVLVREGSFREDLYYRLNVVSIDMPPLRERKDDIQALALCFVRRFVGELKKKVDGLDSEALKLLMRYNWPGNIRELENSIERAMLLTESDQITADDLRLGEVATTQAGRDAQTPVKIPPTGIALEDIERAALIEALKMSNWVQKDAAELLSISPRVMNYKIKTLAIEYPRGRRMVDVA